MGKLVIYRKKDFNNFSRNYKVFFNDKKIGVIEPNIKSKEFYIDSTKGEVRLGVDWCHSNKETVNFQEQDTYSYEVKSTISNSLTILIVMGTLISYSFFFYTRKYLFFIIPLILLIIPIYYITIGRNHYLKISKKH